MKLALTLVLAGVLASVAAMVVPPRTEPPLETGSANSITSFALDHPEWDVLTEGRKDATRFTFNHAWHVSENSSDPRLPLDCTSCHQIEKDGLGLAPISFDLHCRSCHTEDLRTINVAPGIVEPVPVPHGDPSVIRAILDAKLAEWITLASVAPDKSVPGAAAPIAGGKEAGAEIGGEGAPAAQPKRRGPRGSQSAKSGDTASTAGAVPRFTSSEELEEWLASQRAAVFDKMFTQCRRCHSGAERSSVPGEAFTVPPPALPDVWLPRAVFSHQAHIAMDCLQCHGDIKRSTKTSDIGIPGIASCRECHSPAGGAPSTCVTCHVYHPKLDATVSGTATIDDLTDRPPVLERDLAP